MKIRRALVPVALAGLLITGCAATPESTATTDTSGTETPSTEAATGGSATDAGGAGSSADSNGSSDSTGGLENTTKTYSYQGVTVSMPDDWTVVDYGGQKAIAPSADILTTGYVALDMQTAADLSGEPSIDSEDSMKALVENMIRTQSLDVAVSSVSITHDGVSLYKAVLPIDEEDNGGTRYRGEQLIAADGGTVWLVTGLCPDSAYASRWSDFQAIVNSATFSPTTAGSAATE